MAYAEIFHYGNKEYITVDTTWNEKELIKEVPGAIWSPEYKKWKMPSGWAQCIILKGIFKDQITFGPELTSWGWNEIQTRINPAMELRTKVEFPAESKHLGEVFDSRLYDFQRVGAQFLRVAGDCVLGDEMGTGKTVQTLAALKSLGSASLPALVVCPNSTKLNWQSEVRSWFPEAEPIVIAGTISEKTKQFSQVDKFNNSIVIINFESLRSYSRLSGYGSIRLRRCRECDPKHGDERCKASQCEVHQKSLNRIPFKTVIVDEAHKMKDPQSKQTRACWAVMHGKTVQRRWALTGTPLAKHPGDLWSIMHGVAPYEYPTRGKFVDRFCLSGWNSFGGVDIVGVHPDRKDEFFRVLDPRFRRMPKALVLSQLPQKIRQWRNVEMTPKQAKAYQEIGSSFITKLDNGEFLVSPNNISAQIRLLQLSSSYCNITKDESTPDGLKVEMIEPAPKLDALDEIMAEMGDKPLVACAESKQLILLAAKRMEKAKIPYGLITGDQTQWDRDFALKRFQAGELRILLFTIKAGGVGLTMTKADTIVFLQRSWSMIDNKQAEDRVHRIGSEIHESINVIDIITRGTVEERQISNLYTKLKRLEEITRDRALCLQHGQSVDHLDAEEERILGMNLGSLS
jgi:SNF2 family DNA or RNA helicase